MSPPFLDTDVLLCAALQPDRRSEVARELLQGGAVLSVQVLNEFADAARHKLRRPWPKILRALAAIRALCPAPLPLTATIHEAALAVAERSGYGLYDSLILAAALEAGCDTVYSGDLRDGQVIDGRLTIRTIPSGRSDRRGCGVPVQRTDAMSGPALPGATALPPPARGAVLQEADPAAIAADRQAAVTGGDGAGAIVLRTDLPGDLVQSVRSDGQNGAMRRQD